MEKFPVLFPLLIKLWSTLSGEIQNLLVGLSCYRNFILVHPFEDRTLTFEIGFSDSCCGAISALAVSQRHA